MWSKANLPERAVSVPGNNSVGTIRKLVAVAKSGSCVVLKDYLSVTHHLLTLFGKGNYRVSPPKDELLCDAQAGCNSTCWL